ncbi:MAG: spore cortex biosynthesis protein YabQ [Ruminococcus sp.]|nr:spore cortex biosynthesis protein YabQ [Ruminococcus sp.]
MKGDIFQAARDLGAFQGAMIAGLILGVLYDGLRVVRSILPKWRAGEFISDVLYMLAVGTVMFLYSVGTLGKLRYHTFFGTVFGMAAEEMAFGRYFCRWFDRAAGAVKKWAEKRVRDRYAQIASFGEKIKRLFVKSTKVLKKSKKLEKGLES